MVSETFDREFFGTEDGEFFFSPRFVPYKRTAESALIVADTVLKLAYLRAEPGSAFEVDSSEFNVARAFRHTEKIDICSRYDHGVVLCDNVVDD